MATPTDMIEAHLSWMKTGYAENTVLGARKFLYRLHRQLHEGLQGAVEEELAEWLGSGNWSDQTVSAYYKHIVRFYRWSVRPGDPWLSFDPSAGLARPTALPGLPRPATMDVAERCVYRLPMPWRLVCRFTALAGLRPAEVATVEREDVTRENITIKGKGGKTRAIPTHPLIWDIVERMPPGRLIIHKGTPVTAAWVSHSGAYHLRKFGLDITLYRLRHLFGTEVQRRHKDIRVTQELMGHASPNTTMVYTQVTSEAKREAVNALPFSRSEGPGFVAGTGADFAPAGAQGPAAVGPGAPPPPQSGGSGRVAVGRAVRRRLSRRGLQ